jgi:hypothetical protein
VPKYAFVAKEFLEAERIIQFRVSWLDDSGTYRMNRGFRVQVGRSDQSEAAGAGAEGRTCVALARALALA